MYYDIDRLREQAIARAREMFSRSNALVVADTPLAAEKAYTEIVDTEIVDTEIIDEKIVLEKIPQIEPTVFEQMTEELPFTPVEKAPLINIEKVLLLALLYLLYNEKADKQLLLALLYILV
jgi:hypothetical protein